MKPKLRKKTDTLKSPQPKIPQIQHNEHNLNTIFLCEFNETNEGYKSFTNDFGKFEDYQNKCRCCFQKFGELDGKVVITQQHRAIFFKFTSIELVLNENYSNHLCEKCGLSLQKISDFINTVLEMQVEFYNFASNQIFVKQEPEILNDDVLYDDVLIDTSLFEAVKLEPLDTIMDCTVRVNKLNLQNMEYDSYFPEHYIQKNRRSGKKLVRECDLCGFTSSMKATLTKHMRSQHWTSSKYLVCNKCDWKTRIKRYFEYHNLLHHDNEIEAAESEKNINCKMCHKSFSGVAAFFNHMDMVHPTKKSNVSDNEIKFHVCFICGYRCKFKSTLKLHLMGKHKQGNCSILCSLCGKTFPSKVHLASHAKYTHDIKMTTCWLCNASVRTTEFLRHIQVIHPDEEPKVQCEMCPKKYFLEGLKKNHFRRVHQAKVACLEPDCKKIFCYKKSMEDHYNMVHMGKRFTCMVPGCSYKVVRKTKLKRHLWNVHGLQGQLDQLELQ